MLKKKLMAFDLEKLERMMFNLLSNSIKYNKAQGQIEVLQTIVMILLL